ncbi:hypothetical protein IPM19_03990 [bacterium]|nr:MAG: hypothetical protein IPM19_03990 [bacterium]
MLSRLKLIFASIWAKIKGAGKWLVGGLIALVLIVGAIIGINQNDDKKSDTSDQPEIAQVYEPSISTPLPPDNNSESASSGQVAGDSTTSVSATVNDQSTSASEPATTFIAPAAGVDPSQPIKYENSAFGLKAVLPAGAKVDEQAGTVTFYSASGKLLYNVNVVDSKDSYETITAQLKSSSEVGKISKATFAGSEAIQFSTNNLTGYVVLKNSKAYYFIGNSSSLNNITI